MTTYRRTRNELASLTDYGHDRTRRCCSAIALTPVAPAVNLPALQAPSFANVSLAAFTRLDHRAAQHLGDGDQPTCSATPTRPTRTSGPTPSSAPSSVFRRPTTRCSRPPWATKPSVAIMVGLIPQIIDDTLPIISILGYNGTDYLQVASSSSTELPTRSAWRASSTSPARGTPIHRGATRRRDPRRGYSDLDRCCRRSVFTAGACWSAEDRVWPGHPGRGAASVAPRSAGRSGHHRDRDPHRTDR